MKYFYIYNRHFRIYTLIKKYLLNYNVVFVFPIKMNIFLFYKEI